MSPIPFLQSISDQILKYICFSRPDENTVNIYHVVSFKLASSIEVGIYRDGNTRFSIAVLLIYHS